MRSDSPTKKPNPNATGPLVARVRQGLAKHRNATMAFVISVLAILALCVAYRAYLEPRVWKLVAKVPGGSALFWSAAIAAVTTSTESELPQSLVAAAAIFDAARTRKVALNITLVVEAGSRAIDAAEMRPDIRGGAWQTASAAIDYGSALQAHFNVPLDLPDCSSRPPQWVLAKGINDTETALLLRPVFSSCRLDLDLGSSTAGLILPDGSRHKPVEYENGFECRSCAVVYTGGQLSVVAPQLSFQNCVFVFSLTSEPPPDGRKLAKTLLASKFLEAEE
jgi:hypothetical protein